MAPAVGEGHLDVYGLRIRVSGDWREVVEALCRDFAWFASDPAPPDVEVHVARRAPALARFGPLEASAITWRSSEYLSDGRKIVDYLGRAATVEDGNRLEIEGTDGWTAWRAAHEYLLDRAGRHAERVGLTRCYGLGLAGPEGATVVILPSGGGKTTLALRAVAADGIGVMAGDMPLLDRAGQVHAFPLPLLVRTTSAEASTLPTEHLRDLPGIETDPLTLELSAFGADVPRGPVPLRHVVIGVRSLAVEPSLVRTSWRRAGPAFALVTVAGFGSLRGGLRGAPSRLRQAAPRVGAFTAAVRRAEPWRLRLGLDKEANWDALARLL